jgi:hypothetical protein
MEAEFYAGLLERRCGYLLLPDGGSIQPAKAIDLAIIFCDVEEEHGTIKLECFDPPAKDLIERFARWHPTSNDGALAALVTDTARSLLS